jgi:hypothetical protein
MTVPDVDNLFMLIDVEDMGEHSNDVAVLYSFIGHGFILQYLN